MAKMYLYNGLEFPELPNDVDRTVWDFACITDYKEGQANHLLITKSTYKDTIYGVCFKTVHEDQNKGVFFYGNDTVVRRYEIQNGEWVFAEQRYKDEGATGVGFYYDMPIWTNTTIRYDTTENVFLEASEPVPVSTFDLQSWLTGFALGLAGKPLPMGTVEREPVAYLYNGVRLPKLPHVDRTGLPYAYITKMTIFGAVCYNAYFGSEVYYGYSSSGSYCLCRRAGDISWFIDTEYHPSEWRNETVYPNDGVMAEVGENIVWSNFDIHNEDGTLYLAASEPVPIYE